MDVASARKKARLVPIDDIVSKIEELDHVQNELEKLDDEVAAEILAVERRYNALRRPVHARRQAIIDRIPDFWSQAFCNHEMLQGALEAIDVEILKSMSALKVIEAEDIKSGYKITMAFDTNAFFTNRVLEKSIVFNDEGDLKVIPTAIEWKDPTFARQHQNSFMVGFFDAQNQTEDIADLIRESLWPNPLRSYMGVPET